MQNALQKLKSSVFIFLILFVCLPTPGQLDAKSITTGQYHSCAILANGNLKCWGNNANGELGLGDKLTRGVNPKQMGSNLPVVNLGTGLEVSSVVAGDSHTCALFTNGKIKCWGANHMGQLGLGNKDPLGITPSDMGDNLPFVDLGTEMRVISLGAGNSHTCAIFEDGRLKCWGSNDGGTLGLGDTEPRGVSPGQMGSDLPFVDLGEGKKVLKVDSGWRHNCALLSGGEVKCWGYNHAGQLGTENRHSIGDEPDQMGDQLAPVSLGTDFKGTQLTTGSNFSCVVDQQNRVKCWGYSGVGQLGSGSTESLGDNPGEMGDNLHFVPLGTDLKIRSIESSGVHTCVLFENHSLKCWGYNSNGHLALGDSENRGDNPKEMGVNLDFANIGNWLKVKEVSNYMSHSCALFIDHSIKCWGLNRNGQLGLGDIKSRGRFPYELGNNLPFVRL